MKAKTVGSKRKQPESAIDDAEARDDDCELHSAGTTNFKDKGASASENMQVAFPIEGVQDIQEPIRTEFTGGLPRPQQGGYRGIPPDRRPPLGWGDDYRYHYGPSGSGPFGGSFRRPWSPIPFDSEREYDARGPVLADRARQYDKHLDYATKRDIYYSGRGRDCDPREREAEERRRYEDSRFDRRTTMTADEFRRGMSESPATNPIPRSSRIASSPPPSSSGNVIESTKQETHIRRPLFLNKFGVPTGKMESVFHADIVSFVKEMDPTEGWDGQTASDKDRLMERLMHHYEFYGDSKRLSDRYLKKKAGGALIQFRYSMNQLIDKGAEKPEDFNLDYWEELVRRRNSTEAKVKSEKMANIARGRAAKNTTKRALEQTIMIQLAKELKREPYASEIEEAVQKQWATLKVESADRKRLRATASASNAALQSNKDMENRLLHLETFMNTWKPQMELWKEMYKTLQQRNLPECNASTERTEKDLSVVPTSGGQTAVEVPPEEGTDSSDDDEGSDISKSSAHDGTESNSSSEKHTSEDEDDSEEDLQVVNVVEPAQQSVIPVKAKQKIDIAPIVPASKKTTVLAVSKPRANTGIVTKLTNMPEAKSGVVAADPPESNPIPVQTDGLNEDQEVAENAQQEVTDKETRSRKKAKNIINSSVEAGAVAEAAISKGETTVEKVVHNFKTPRKPAKFGIVKADKRKEKEMAIVAGDMMLLENSDPQKFLALGSLVRSDFDRDLVVMPAGPHRELVRVRLKRVIFPSAPLAYVEVGTDGEVECRTLGEAFLKQCVIWWPAPRNI